MDRGVHCMPDGTIGNTETDDETNDGKELFVSLLKETPNEDAPCCSVFTSR